MLIIENIIMEHIRPTIAKLQEVGIKIIEGQNKIRVYSDGIIKSVDIKTLPYPGFPTDMQSQIVVLLSIARGTSIMVETVFENRYKLVEELSKMGANIKIEGRLAVIKGVKKLIGANIFSKDLRGGAGLILAGLIAEGETTVNDIEYVERGYENIEEKLKNVGAIIKKI